MLKMLTIATTAATCCLILLNACAGKGSSPATISKVLGSPGSGDGANGKDAVLAKAIGKDCLDIFSLITKLITRPDNVKIYTNDLDLATLNPTTGTLDSIADDISRAKNLLPQLKFDDSQTDKTLISDLSPVKPLLEVMDHDGCNSVTFSDGHGGSRVFKADTTTPAQQGSVTLSEGSEIRKYTYDQANQRLVIQVLRPPSPAPELCPGSTIAPNSLVFKETSVVSWASDGPLILSRNLVALMDKALPIPVQLKNQLSSPATPTPTPVAPLAQNNRVRQLPANPQPNVPAKAGTTSGLSTDVTSFLKIQHSIDGGQLSKLQCKAQ